MPASPLSNVMYMSCRSKMMLSLRYLSVYCLDHVKEDVQYTAAIKNPAAWYSLKSGRYV